MYVCTLAKLCACAIKDETAIAQACALVNFQKFSHLQAQSVINRSNSNLSPDEISVLARGLTCFQRAGKAALTENNSSSESLIASKNFVHTNPTPVYTNPITHQTVIKSFL